MLARRGSICLTALKKILPQFFQNDCAILRYQLCMIIPIVPQLLQYVMLLVFLSFYLAEHISHFAFNLHLTNN